MKADLTHAQHLLDAGMNLVPLIKNTKRPPDDEWNKHFAESINPKATGYGIHLASNGLCSIDPDHYEMAKAGVAAWGFDLDEVMSAGVRTHSTRRDSGGRSAFATIEGLRWLSLRAFNEDNEGTTVLELRATSGNLQDVVPGLVYVDKTTGEMCTQTYANGKTLADKPTLPEAFAEHWRRMSEDWKFYNAQSKLFVEAIGQAGHTVHGKPVVHVPSLFRASDNKLSYPSKHRMAFNEAHSVEDVLGEHGYPDMGNGRWRHPGATGSDGIRLIPGKKDLWYSDHGGDPLHGMFDAWTAHVQLSHKGDVRAAERVFRGIEVGDHPLLRFREWSVPTAPAFIIEGVLTDKLSVFASYPGKGKTSAWVSLCAVVCGAIEMEKLKVVAPRHVVFVSEHPEQVELMLHALVQRGLADAEAFQDRFHVVEAKKMLPEDLVEAAPELRQYAVAVTRNDVSIDLAPYVVLDTAAAVIDIEDENDNSAWSKAIATLKQEFDGIPTTIIAHTSKEHKHGDASTMTVRGASAIEGDVTQVLFLSNDDDEKRYIEVAAAKHRFTAGVESIQLESHLDQVLCVDAWGEKISEVVLTVDLVPMAVGERAQLKAQAAQEKKDMEHSAVNEAVLQELREAAKRRDNGKNSPSEYPSARKLAQLMPAPKNAIEAAIARLKAEGEIVDAPVPSNVKLPGGVKWYLAAGHPGTPNPFAGDL